MLVPLLDFEVGSVGPLLNLIRVLVPTFNLWGGFQVPGPEVLVPLLHHADRYVLLFYFQIQTIRYIFKRDPMYACLKYEFVFI